MDRHPRFLKDATYRLIATVERYLHHVADLQSDIDQMCARLEMAVERLEGDDDEGHDEENPAQGIRASNNWSSCSRSLRSCSEWFTVFGF